jgi:hypothetical protein
VGCRFLFSRRNPCVFSALSDAADDGQELVVGNNCSTACSIQRVMKLRNEKNMALNYLIGRRVVRPRMLSLRRRATSP